MKRMITMIVLHCSATRCNRTYSVQQLYHDHVEVNRWSYIGYHEYILRSGKSRWPSTLLMVGNCWCNCTMSLAIATFCSGVRVSAGLPFSSKPPS